MDSDFSAIRESLPEVGETPKKVCVVCQAPADKSCSACHGVVYCTAEHQKSHWKVHRKDCPPIKIVNSPELGPHFVATRDLPPWTLLLTELPALVNPFITSEDHPGIIYCISCRSIIPSVPRPCLKCSTPYFCNLACSMNKIHEFECGILSKCSKRQREKLCMPPNLMYLRAIHLKNNDPQTWNKLLELRGANQYKDVEEDDKWFIREILPLLGGKGLGFEADMIKLRGIHQQRGILVSIRNSLISGGHGECTLLYLKASNFPHNCFANCTQIIGQGPELQLQVRNNIGLKKGTIPSIDYVGVSYMVGAIARQHRMHDLKGALCICPRCTDPSGTELGTMLSAVKCEEPNCKEGYLLPVNVRDMGENAPWRCNKSGCNGKGSTWAKIEKLTSGCEYNAGIFLKRGPEANFELMNEFFESLKKKLHPNHYILFKFGRVAAAGLNCQIMIDMRASLPRLDLHITMMENLVKIMEIKDPGFSFNRGSLLNQLFNGLNQRLLWYPEVQQRAVQRQLMERAIEVFDTFLPIAKCYPDVWTVDDIQFEMERRRMLQMALKFELY